ncbi:MAG: sigma-54-dependent Fis family transcriptional regulator [Phycisphaerales bacterium]|nr:sigma-54-dependent Fis family transcriptional regulator [Phycisphaerales bacterium]
MNTDHPSVLIVDDEFSVRDSLSRWLRKDGFDATPAESGETALAAAKTRHFDAAVVDIKMPGMDGLDLQAALRGIDPDLAVIIITAYASVDSAVRALKDGAFDYVTKPVDPAELSHLLQRAVEKRRLSEENSQLRRTIDDLVSVDMMVGQSPAIRKVMELIRHVAPTDATVLVVGESGTGKELIARAIHANSPRRYRPIISVNCGAIPESLLESELFGHEKGAFTGATAKRRGKIEMADGGTLFLDEVGAISPKTQVELLRVLEEKSFTRVGGHETVHVDFRVVCATNENLEDAVRAGRFREDFFYRINVFTIEAPPLRSRREDIPLLARHFVERFARQMDRRITDISPEAMRRLCEHDWPGNVRELCNAIERAMVVGTPPTIQAEDLPFSTRRPAAVAGAAGPGPGDSLEDVEKRHIESILERTGWNITQAAAILRVDRVTVYNKIRKFGLAREPAQHQGD